VTINCEGSANFYGGSGGYAPRHMTRIAFRDCSLDTDGNMFFDDVFTKVRLIDASDAGRLYHYYPDMTDKRSSLFTSEFVPRGTIVEAVVQDVLLQLTQDAKARRSQVGRIAGKAGASSSN
jgi:hypothetical protein